MKEIEFEELNDDEKRVLLSAYDYKVDEHGQIWDSLLNEKIVSKSTGKQLTLKNLGLITGSLHIMDSDPISISKFIRENLENDS